MRKIILKTLFKLTMTFAIIFSLCEVVSLHGQSPEQDRKVLAAQNPTVGQYIPENLDYSEVIREIKREEGVLDIEESDVKNQLSENEKSNQTPQTVSKNLSPEKYLNSAKILVNEALSVQDESEKRAKVRKAMLYYQEYLKHHPSNLEAMLGEGAMATYLGKETEAKNILMQAYATYPNNPKVHKALGDYSFKFANFNNAIEYYNLSLSSGNLKDYATNIATAVCYEKLGDIEKAITYYQVAQHLNPQSELANQRLQMYEEMEKDGYKADSRLYEDAVKTNENNDVELETLILDAEKIK